MQIVTVTSPDFQENTYLVVRDSQAVVIDPGSDAAEIKSQILNHKSQIKYILLTHGHYDHILGASAMAAPIYAHEAEKQMIETPEINLSSFVAGDRISIKGVNYFGGAVHKMDEFEFYHTPGHTAGCVVIKAGNNLFTGDTLFEDTVGRTDVPTGDSKELRKSLKIFDSFDKNLMCYPGHGAPFLLADAYKVNYFLKSN